MITKVQGEAPFQVLTNNFSISPSNEGYTLQISADGKEYSDLFTVAANTTRLVSNVAANSYYRLKGNDSEVSVNWMRTCVTEGQGGGGETYTAGANINISDQNVISVSGLSTINGSAITAGGDIVIEGGGDMSEFWDSATTKTYVDSADTVVYASATSYADSAATIAYNSAATYINDVELVMSSALNEFHTQIQEISGQSVDLSAYYTSAQTDAAISAATSGKADAANFSKRRVRVNGNYVDYYSTTTGGVDYYFYAPANGGTAGEILVSRGNNNSPTWSAMPAADVTKDYVDSAVTEVSDHLYEVEEVTASAITYLDGLIAELSGTTPDLSAYWTSAVTDEHIVSAITPIQSAITVIDQVIPAAIVDINNRMVSSTSVHTIWQGLQSEYDALTNSGATADPATLYIIKSN